MRALAPAVVRRAIAAALALSVLTVSLAGAASPAGTLDAEFSFRDEPGTSVLSVYPFSDVATQLSYLRVKGPRVSWVDGHETAHGVVGWRVTVQTAPSKTGPWDVESRTSFRTIAADTMGPPEAFSNRTVAWADRPGQLYVRLISRLVWFEGDQPIALVRHIYTSYGLVMSSELAPDFGAQTETRKVTPNVWNP